MKKLLIVILIVIAVIVGIIIIWTPNSKESAVDMVDSLESKIDSIYIEKEIILERIDTIYMKIEDNNNKYEQNINDILDNDVNEDYIFFREYINSQRDRFDRTCYGF